MGIKILFSPNGSFQNDIWREMSEKWSQLDWPYLSKLKWQVLSILNQLIIYQCHGPAKVFMADDAILVINRLLLIILVLIHLSSDTNSPSFVFVMLFKLSLCYLFVSCWHMIVAITSDFDLPGSLFGHLIFVFVSRPS